MRFSIACAAIAVAFVQTTGADLDPIISKGSKFFFKSNGTQFFIKGIAYQEDISQSSPSNTTYSDPLADPEGCKRDIPYLKELGTNTIRVYAVDPTKDHQECMQLLQDAGIYVVSDLSEPSLSINRDAPEWDDDLYTRYTSVVDVLAPYSNVLGFFAGNEVSNNASNTNASPFVKAAVRDMRAYIKQKSYREIPVGYATNDDSDIRLNLAHYFNCNTESETIDFWGYNIYSWCGDSNFHTSGYDVRTQEFSNYSKPVFFAEYGCNIGTKVREFTEVAALYGNKMTPVWSGGIVYMYFEEANNYGLVEVKGNNVKKLPDFNFLENEIAKADPIGVQLSSYTEKNTKLEECPAISSTWGASPKLPPTPNKKLCSCMTNSLNCIASDKIDDKTVEDLFSFICGGSTDCTGIRTNGTSGEYGAYSMCNPMERLSWAMNAYFLNQNKAKDACDFSGSGTKQTPTDDSSCTALLKEAGGIAGTGTVTSSPSTDDKKSGAANIPVLSLGFGTFKFGAALVVAFFGSIFMAI